VGGAGGYLPLVRVDRSASWLKQRRGRVADMAQTKEGAEKVRAKTAGVSLDELRTREASGLKWCYACKAWHMRSEFAVDSSRYDGLTPLCAMRRNARQRDSYLPLGKPDRNGPLPLPARDGDREQARQRVNNEVKRGRLPRPDSLPCMDCGHVRTRGDRRRHEYDHYLGYAAENQFDVQAVCSLCHAKRHADIPANRGRDDNGRFIGSARRTLSSAMTAQERRVSHG
jgi:hypothetical protein